MLVGLSRRNVSNSQTEIACNMLPLLQSVNIVLVEFPFPIFRNIV